MDRNIWLYTPESVNRAIKRIYEDYNKKEEETAKKENIEPLLLPHFSCHHLRHTFCTRLCENESNLKVIKSVMGHSDIQTTMISMQNALRRRNRRFLLLWMVRLWLSNVKDDCYRGHRRLNKVRLEFIIGFWPFYWLAVLFCINM